MTIKDRIKVFLKNQGISQAKFEKAAGLSNGYINGLKKSPGADKLQNIFCAYPMLNREWLLTGEGAMLQGDGGPASQPGPEAEKTGESGEGDAMMALISGQLREKDAVICRQMEEIRELERENGRLQERNGQLADQVERLTESNKELRAQVARLTPSASPLAELTPRL